MPLAVSIAHTATQLAALRVEWLALLARSALNQPMLSPLWVLPWWNIFGAIGKRELMLVCLRARDRLVGLAPLVRRPFRYNPLLSLQRIEPLGTGEDEADEVFSEYLGLIAEHGSEVRVAETFADALARGALGPCDELYIPMCDTGSPLQALDDALSRRGFDVGYARRTSAPYIALPGKWDEYLARLSGNARANVRKSVREMEKHNAGPLRVHEADAGNLDAGLAILDQLHGARWAEDGKPGMFASERFSAFLAGSSRELLAEGALQLLWLEGKDGPLAAVYNLIWDNKVFFYQSGRRMDLPAKLRPGTALHALAIQRAIAEGRREYDFMAGAQRYKLELATDSRELVDLHASAPSWKSAARRRVQQATTALHSLRSHLPRLG